MSNAGKTGMITTTVLYAETGLTFKKDIQVVSVKLLIKNLILETIIDGICKYAVSNEFGLTLCVPLRNNPNIRDLGTPSFVGAYCSDILATLSV